MSATDIGPWYRPSQAAPLLGMSARAVRDLCHDEEIDHRRSFGPAGDVRLKISRQAIERYLNRTTTRTSVRRSA
jgi:hypothetical protein